MNDRWSDLHCFDRPLIGGRSAEGETYIRSIVDRRSIDRKSGIKVSSDVRVPAETQQQTCEIDVQPGK